MITGSFIDMGDPDDGFDWDAHLQKSQGHGHATTGFALCSKTHPALQIGEHVIYGGSCLNPVITDADVYIGFDRGMALTTRRFPWAKGDEIFFPISDMQPPQDVKGFKQLVSWTVDQLGAGRKVHAGCIGGHGRTGMFLAALTKEMIGEVDAISYVRKHYCDRAVETESQINFLVQTFGIKKIAGSKKVTSFSSVSYPTGKSSGSGKKHTLSAASINVYDPIKSKFTLFTRG